MKKISHKALALSICLIAATGLITGNAGSRTASVVLPEYDVPSVYVPSANELISEGEFKDLTARESGLALPEDFFEAAPPGKTQRWVDSFVYTELGGLDPANPKCKLFLDEKGEYGSYGKIIQTYINEEVQKNGFSILLSNSILGMDDAPRACPNWRSLDDATKTKFWVWTFAAIASKESSCTWDIPEVWGVNDTCTGLLQLEKGVALRSYRGPECAKVSPTDIRKPYANLRCGMDIMKAKLTSRDGNKELVYDGRLYPGDGMKATSYWEKLRKVNGGGIGKLVRSFTPCGAETPAQ